MIFAPSVNLANYSTPNSMIFSPNPFIKPNHSFPFSKSRPKNKPGNYLMMFNTIFCNPIKFEKQFANKVVTIKTKNNFLKNRIRNFAISLAEFWKTTLKLQFYKKIAVKEKINFNAINLANASIEKRSVNNTGQPRQLNHPG